MSDLFDKNGLFLDIISDSFIQKHTRFATTKEWFSLFPHLITTKEEFNALPVEKIDEFINQQTTFQSWNEMQASAAIDDILDDSDTLV